MSGHERENWTTGNAESQVRNDKGRIVVDFVPRPRDCRLIAAAPDLLAACKEALPILRQWENDGTLATAMVEAAIAKAEAGE